MTIKKRLALSNLFMILVPVCITGAMALVCLGLIWAFVVSGSGLGFADSEDFFRACGGVAAVTGEALEGSADEQRAHLEELSRTLDESAMSLRILREGEAKPFYAYGAQSAGDEELLLAAAALGGEGIVSRAGRSLYVRSAVCEGVSYEIQLFGSEHEVSYHTLKLAVVFVGIVLLFVVAVSIYVTNRFLTRFVLRRIEVPLDILSAGAREIGAGNLEYRIEYSEPDEFAPVCAQFNEMAARLKASVDETQRHEESRKELMASLSHDLRSPLTAILAYVEGLLDGVASTPEKQKAYLLTIQAKAEQLRDMVSEIFLYSKMELEAFPVRCEVMRLDEALAALARELGAEYSSRGLELEFCAAEPLEVLADPELLRRCVVNILDNSAKYKTAPVCRAKLEARPCEGGAALLITDDGPGVPEDALPRLFDVFYRADAARSDTAQGSGLGLAIVGRAARRMGGRAAARNMEPHGLCVEITLPGGKQNAEAADS